MHMNNKSNHITISGQIQSRISVFYVVLSFSEIISLDEVLNLFKVKIFL